MELLTLLDEIPECFSESPGFSDIMVNRINLKEGFRPKRLPANHIPEPLEPD